MTDSVPDEDSLYIEVVTSRPDKPPVMWETNNRDSLFNYLDDDSAARLAQELGLVETERGSIHREIQELYHQIRDLPPPQPALPAQPEPITTTAPAAPSPDSKVVGGESPATLDAPDVTAGTSVDITRPPFAVSPWQPADAVVQQKDPLPADYAAYIASLFPANNEPLGELQLRIERHQPLKGEPELTGTDPAARAPARAGDPVDLFAGRLTISATDLVIPTAVMPILMQRGYCSGPGYYGPFGRAWDHGYNIYLRSLNDGSIAYWTGQLRELRFRPRAAGGWDPDPGITARLEQGAAADRFEIINPGGVRLHFERPASWGNAERIPISAITDRHGNTITVSYDTQDRVATVLDEAGRGLLFSYGNCGLLERVTDHTKTRIIRYEHDSEVEHLAQVILPATAQYPNGITTTYEYDTAGAHPAMRDNILRISDAAGNTYLENEYAGPEVGWAFNSVTRQVSGEFEYQFDYEQIQYVPPDVLYVDVPATRTSVLMPDGALHVHTFNYRGDLLDQRDRLVRDGSNRVVAIQFAYDTQGNLTEMIAPDGLRQLMTFDATNPDPCARRNLLRVEIAAPLTNLVPSRVVQRTEYDPRYQLPIRARDEAGQETRYVYDFDTGIAAATGALVRVEEPTVALSDGTAQQSVTDVESNTRGQVTAVIAPEGCRTTFAYLTGGLRDGMIATVTSDQLGDALTTVYDYDVTGYPLHVTAPGGAVTALQFNAIGLLEVVTPPAVNGTTAPTRTWYGDAGSPVRIERPKGSYTDATLTDPFIADIFERDALGRTVGAHAAANTAHPRVMRQRLDHEGRSTVMTDSTGVVTERCYDERGALIRERHAPGTPDEAVTRLAYDRPGRLINVTDPAGWETAIYRDVWGRIQKINLPGGVTRTNTWETRDLLIETTDEGRPGPGLASRVLTRTAYQYDARRRLTATTVWSFADDPATGQPLTVSYTYDREDRIRRVDMPRGSHGTFDYDPLGRLTRATDQYGTTRDRSYNAAGELAAETLTQTEGGIRRVVSSTFEYDARVRLIAITDPSGRRELDYDDRNSLVERRDPGNVTTRVATSPFGETTSILLDPGGLNIFSKWVYDDAGQLSEFIDPTGATTTWGYDRLGRRSQLTLPDGSSWRTSYNLPGRRVEQTMPSGTRIVQELEFNGQPTSLECFAGPGVETVSVHKFDYDALGRLVLATHRTGTIKRRYDSIGRLLEETAGSQTIGLHYNDLTGDVDLIYPDGRRERTRHDSTGRPTLVTLETSGTALAGTAGEELAAISYAVDPTRIIHSNGVETILSYDRPGRLVSIDHVRGAELLDGYRARYDERERRVVVQLAGEPFQTSLNHFDTHDRLDETRSGFPFPPLPHVITPADHAAAITAATIAAAAASFTETYQLDAADGRQQRTRTTHGSPPVTDTNLLGPDHRILSAAGHPITHHADGPRATDDQRRYDVDALGRVVRISDVGSGTVLATFSYDALARPATGTVAGAAFARTFLGEAWVHETRGVSEAVRQATPHPLWPQPLQVRDAVDTLFIHPDEGLSTLCVTDAAGTVRERHRYGPFGEPGLFAGDGATALSPDAASPEPRWRGMPLISALGLYASTQRLYDPELGVFLARDPALYIDSASPWVFAAHDPVNHLDPSGRSKSPLGAAPMEWQQTSPAEIASRKFDRTLTYDLPPDETGYRGEDYFGYALIYGLKQTVWNPTRAWLLDERPRYLDNQGHVQRTSWRPDRYAEMSVAVGTVAQLFMPTPKTPALRGGLLDTLLGRVPGADLERSVMMGGKPGEVLTALENDIEVGYGADYTRVGNDPHTLRMTDGRQPWPNTHDVIVHAEASGHRVSPGVAGARGTWSVVETHEAQIAEAVNMNPNLRPGQPIRLLACAVDAEQAQTIATLTGRPVFASPWTVGIEAGFGPLPVRQFVAWDPALMSWAAKAPEQAVWQLFWP